MKKFLSLFIFSISFIFFSYAEENKWDSEIAFNLSFPFTNNNVSIDVNNSTEKDSIDTKGVGLVIGGRVYRKTNGLTLLAETGISYATSPISGFDDDFDGFLLNLDLGIGKRFGFNNNKGSFIPAFIIGFHSLFLNNTFKLYGYEFDIDIDAVAFEIGGNIYASYLLGEKFGICGSFDFTCNIGGFGDEKVSYSNYSQTFSFDIDVGRINFLPSIGFFIKA